MTNVDALSPHPLPTVTSTITFVPRNPCSSVSPDVEAIFNQIEFYLVVDSMQVEAATVTALYCGIFGYSNSRRVASRCFNPNLSIHHSKATSIANNANALRLG